MYKNAETKMVIKNQNSKDDGQHYNKAKTTVTNSTFKPVKNQQVLNQNSWVKSGNSDERLLLSCFMHFNRCGETQLVYFC